METKYKGRVDVSQRNICPYHHLGPFITLENDQITVRCCCDFFTGKYISSVDKKFRGITLKNIIKKWEADLLMNELYYK